MFFLEIPCWWVHQRKDAKEVMSNSKAINSSSNSMFANVDQIKARLAAKRAGASQARREMEEILHEMPTAMLASEAGRNALPQNPTQAAIQGGAALIWAAYQTATAVSNPIGTFISATVQALVVIGAINLAKNDQGEMRELVRRAIPNKSNNQAKEEGTNKPSDEVQTQLIKKEE